MLEWALLFILLIGLGRFLAHSTVGRQDELFEEFNYVVLEVAYLCERVTELKQVFLVLLFCLVKIFHVESSLFFIKIVSQT